MRNVAGGVVALAAAGLLLAGTKPAPMPPVTVRLPGVEWGYGTQKFTWEGVSVVADPVNKETLYLCGRNGGVPFGSIGSWALAEDGTTWRELTFKSAALDPLRADCLAARRAARDGENAARNIFYAGLDAAPEAAAVKSQPARLVGEAAAQTEDLAILLDKTERTDPAAAAAMARAKPLVSKAAADLKAAQSGLAAGQLDATLLKRCFEAQWALDEAADCLANSPGPRQQAAAAYDPENRCIVLFGGNHGDYVMSDTWVYDCAAKTWRQVWPMTAPPPRCAATFAWDAERKRLVLTGGQTILRRFEYYKHYEDLPKDAWTFDAKTGEWTGAGGVAPGTRTYRSIVPCYDPCWYDGAPRGDAKAVTEWLAQLAPNVWSKVPRQERPAAERDWGTACLDPDRDLIFRWTGGHCSDPSTAMSTYHPGINRWSLSYIPEICGKGMSFNGRPDCMNHTYLNYAYDPLSKRLICTSMGGTGVYNPDRGDFDYSADQPFNRHIYLTCTVGTPKGVMVWTQGYLGLFDAAARTWTRLLTKSTLPANATDGSGVAHDSKRDCLWMFSLAGYEKPLRDVWRCDPTTGEVQAMKPEGLAEIGGAMKFCRETVYLPKLDLVLLNNFVGGKMVAYDPQKNRLLLLNIDKAVEKQGSNLGSYSMGMMYDPKRDLVWGMGNYKDIFVLKIDPKTAF
jgi:hypothetical protein